MDGGAESNEGNRAMTCIDHLEFTGSKCLDCGHEVNDYGNTEYQYEYCSFPSCGCDGSRNCDAPSGASSASLIWNREKGTRL